MGRLRIDLTNRRFGRLIAISIDGTNKHGYNLWKCECDCGNITFLPAGSLVSGGTKSCGCLHREKVLSRQTLDRTIHGMYRTPTHYSWSKMLERCYNPNHIHYKNYGGRGIIVCDEWKDFRNFYIDMGERPEGKTLDRIDNEDNYKLSNCRWATAKEQSSNRRLYKKNY